MEVTGLEKTIDFYIDENKFYRSSIDFGLVTVNLTDLLPVEITKKEINKLTRLLAKLKAHGIIKKVARKNKYYLTTNGRKITNSILIYTRKTLLN